MRPENYPTGCAASLSYFLKVSPLRKRQQSGAAWSRTLNNVVLPYLPQLFVCDCSIRVCVRTSVQPAQEFQLTVAQLRTWQFKTSVR